MWGSTLSTVPFRGPHWGPHLLRPSLYWEYMWMVHIAQIFSLLSWHDYCIKCRPWGIRGSSSHSLLCLFLPSLNVWVDFKDPWLVSHCPGVTSSCAHPVTFLSHVSSPSPWPGLSQWSSEEVWVWPQARQTPSQQTTTVLKERSRLVNPHHCCLWFSPHKTKGLENRIFHYLIHSVPVESIKEECNIIVATWLFSINNFSKKWVGSCNHFKNIAKHGKLHFSLHGRPVYQKQKSLREVTRCSFVPK